jgi:hypothetical protein
MFNPLLPDLSKLKNEDIELKITELMKKYLIASQSGQGQVCQQIGVILDSYRQEQQFRYTQANKKLASQNKNLDDYINVDR